MSSEAQETNTLFYKNNFIKTRSSF